MATFRTLATTDIAHLLAQRMPLGQMLVRRIEPERACIETAGIGPDRSSRRSLGDRNNCTPAHVKRLLAWCQRREVLRWPHGGRPDQTLAAAIPSGLGGELCVGPLASEHETYGMILLYATPGQQFTSLHEQMLQGLLEPCAIALENDRRLRELLTLREAAEADKQALLRRLGRAEMAETIVGAEGRLRPVMERVALVSRSDVPVIAATHRDLALLTQYAWPGNIRELAAVIDRATILGVGQCLEVAKALGVIPPLRPVLPMSDQAPVASSSAAATILPLDAALQQHIEAALRMTYGRVDGPHGAARLLRINPHALRGKMRKLAINWRQFRSGPSS